MPIEMFLQRKNFATVPIVHMIRSIYMKSFDGYQESEAGHCKMIVRFS